MFKNLSNLSVAFGLALVASQTCLYTVDPGEKVMLLECRHSSWTAREVSARKSLDRVSTSTFPSYRSPLSMTAE